MALKIEKKRSVRSLAGFLVMLLVYVSFALAAAFFFPGDFSPFRNTLAQLGDAALNPSGAIFYVAGVLVISGMTFFVAVALLVMPKEWIAVRGGSRRMLFYLTSVFMLMFTVFYLLTTFFPEGSLNSLFSLVFLVCLELFIVFSSAGIRRLRNHVPWIPSLGFAVATANFLLVVGSAATGWPIFSWFISVLSWSYTVAFIYEFSGTEFSKSFKQESFAVA